MKRISETLMAMAPTGHPLVEAARDALKLPARNHAPVEGDHWRPACDRFVLPGDWFEALDQVFDSLDARLAAISVARAPLLPCFIECGKLGFFLYGDATSPNVTAFERSDRSRVVPIVTFVLSEANKARFADEGEIEIRCEASSPTEGMLAHARAFDAGRCCNACRAFQPACHQRAPGSAVDAGPGPCGAQPPARAGWGAA